MNKKLLSLAVCFIALIGATTAAAQPQIHKYTFSDGSIVQKMSDNGVWGVALPCYDDAINSSQARLININTDEVIELQEKSDVVASGVNIAKDVSDDGNIVVGRYQGMPAYWTKATKTWTTLPIDTACTGGTVLSVTPDGKYAVGACDFGDSTYQSKGEMWNLETGTIVELPNKPLLDMTNVNQNQVRYTDISPDGRYIVMYMSFSYVMPASLCVWVYDRETSSAKAIGFTPNDTTAWTPKAEGLYFVEEPAMSPNGKWVAINTYMIDKDGVAHEYPGRYNVESDEMTIYTDVESDGMIASSIDNNGNLFAATPKANPLRNWSMRYGSYWFDIKNILKQYYGFDLLGKIQFENSGTTFSLSNDGKRIAVMCDPLYGSGYVLDIPNQLDTICQNINLLGDYTITPASGSTFTKLQKLYVTFDRNIEILGDYTKISLTKGESNEFVRAASSILVDSKDPQMLEIAFRSTTFEKGTKYTITIPDGIVCVKGDKVRVNDTIRVEYTGRGTSPVGVTKLYPERDTESARIANQSSNITINFDAYVAITDTASAQLINLTDNSVTELNLLSTQNKVAVYPSSLVYLYNGLNYKVVVKAGSITDITGSGASDEIVINYTGTYEPEINTDDDNVFIETFSNYSAALAHLMRYEGDHLTPISDMKSWLFDTDNTPWNFYVSDEASDNYCAASHSMYDPAGQSDDWMVTPQLYLPDKFCYLSFKAQSYQMYARDTLTVLVWESDSVVYSLNENAINKIKAEADTIFREKLSMGSNQDELAGDWVDYRVDLSKYGGKNVYVAFLNDNNNQSALFVDSIVVKRNMKFLIGLQNVKSVVDKESIAIKGRVTANDDEKTFSNLSVALYDSEGNKIDEYSKDNLSLSKGKYQDFSFTNELPLKPGVENKFTVKVQLDDYFSETTSSVKNLAFQPTKRVVLEEMTGATCVNCPQGILAIENLEKLYHDLFIPISLHTYTGDPMNTGQDDYCQYLGLSAAPSGIVQRSGIISMPMGTDYFTFQPTFSNGYNLWADYVAAELQQLSEADINISVKVDEENQTYSIPVDVKYALNAKNLNLNLFLVILEDDVISYQQNNLGGKTNAIYGDWGSGGRYDKAINYNIAHRDVVRSQMASFEGAGGFLPQTMEAGKEYTTEIGPYDLPSTVGNLDRAKAVVMLIDGNNGSLINAARALFPGYITGINDVKDNATAHQFRLAGGNLQVIGEGEAKVEVFSLSGVLLASEKGKGSFEMPVSHLNGNIIVKMTSAGKTTVKKYFIK